MKTNPGRYGLLFLFLLLSCSKNGVDPGRYGLAGSWRLYEQGSSPGFGYIVEPVPAKPLQSLTFTANGALHSQGDRLTGFFQLPYYRVDSSQPGLRLQFLVSKKDRSSTNSVGFQITGDTMRIVPTCYEGCHFGFVRIR